jgi:hypothetical protein
MQVEISAALAALRLSIDPRICRAITTIQTNLMVVDPAIYLGSGAGGSSGKPYYRDTGNTVFES